MFEDEASDNNHCLALPVNTKDTTVIFAKRFDKIFTVVFTSADSQVIGLRVAVTRHFMLWYVTIPGHLNSNKFDNLVDCRKQRFIRNKCYSEILVALSFEITSSKFLIAYIVL